MLQKVILTLSLTSLIFVSGCGDRDGFTSPAPTPSSEGGAGGNQPGDGNTTPDPYESLIYKGYVSGGNNNGSLVVDIDKTNGALLLIMPLEQNPFIDSAEGTIPDLPGVKFMTYKNDKGASFIAVSVPLRYVLKGASFLDPARLPNGDPLPQIAGGELPSIAIRIPGKNNVRFHLYLGVDTVGIYVSSPFNPYIGITFPIKNGLTTIGFLTSVPAKATYDGGFFLSTRMPAEIARIIDNHFKF